jgi:methionine sulfoxide reductase heme-binding subunit
MRWLGHPVIKPGLFVLCLLPAALLTVGALQGQLGANPAETLIRSLGDWSLRFLVLTLAITPVRVLIGLPVLARWRRMLGLFTFFYASLHWLAYVWFDMGFIWSDVLADIPRRPFVLVGTFAWLLLLALALTSFDRVIRSMGAQRWRSLHRSVYLIAVLAVLHFLWMRAGKNDYAEVWVYALLLGGLLGWRLWRTLARGAKASG